MCTCNMSYVYMGQRSLGTSSGLWILLFADMIIFPAGFYANGIAEGLMMQQAIPSTYWRQENLVILSLLLVSLARLIGAPLARFLVHAGGRNAYAACQLALGCLAITSVSKVASKVEALADGYSAVP